MPVMMLTGKMPVTGNRDDPAAGRTVLIPQGRVPRRLPVAAAGNEQTAALTVSTGHDRTDRPEAADRAMALRIAAGAAPSANYPDTSINGENPEIPANPNKFATALLNWTPPSTIDFELVSLMFE